MSFNEKVEIFGSKWQKNMFKGQKMTPMYRRVEEEAEVHISNIKGI